MFKEATEGTFRLGSSGDQEDQERTRWKDWTWELARETRSGKGQGQSEKVERWLGSPKMREDLELKRVCELEIKA